jgi:ATP-dependent RNA helicase DeaD
VPTGTPAVDRKEPSEATTEQSTAVAAERPPRERRERRDRPPREGRPPRDFDATPSAGAPEHSRSKMSDREIFEQLQHARAATPAAATAQPAAAAPAAPTGRPRMSDRELFERMQRGEPLPPIEDPTSDGPDEASAEAPRERRERRDRGERRERRERAPRETPQVEAGHARLWLNLGKLDGLNEEAGIPAALEALGAPAGKVTKTELRGSYSYIHVADGDVAAFEALVGKKHNEKALKVERAREH